MGKIVISTNMTLDGVVEDPDGKDGSARGGWFNQFGGQDLGPWAAFETAEAQKAQALLLGRHSDAWFGARWNTRTGEWADRLSGLPKYVVSKTISQGVWKNSIVLKGELAKELKALKQKVDGEILLYGSRQLAQAALALDLVDEVRLMVFPIVLGAGKRLFDDGAAKKPMRLVHTRTIGEGLVFFSYAPVREG